MIVKQLQHDDAKKATRWGIAVISGSGEIEILSESRETKEQATAEAQRILGWQSFVSVAVLPLTVHVGEMEMIISPEKATRTPEDKALRSLDGVA